jgi:hypothetical protein
MHKHVLDLPSRKKQKVDMNVAGKERATTENVLPLFGGIQVPESEGHLVDPLQELLNVAQAESEVAPIVQERRRDIVTSSQPPEQAMYTLEKQLQGLRKSLDRIKFYLGEIEDLLPG